MKSTNLKFSYTANVSGIINKLPQGSNEFWKITKTEYWQKRSGTVNDLADHISKGFAWMPAVLKENCNRANANVACLEILGSDIDDGLTIEKAIANEFVKKYCALGIETASSKPDHNKFRLVWILPVAIVPQLSRYIYNEIAINLGTSDPACKDEARFFYGAKGKEPFLIQGDRTLPYWIIDKAKAAYQAEIDAQEASRERIAQYQANRVEGDWSDAQLASSCLEYIDPSVGYEEWRNILLACHASGLSETEARKWSQGASNYTDKGFYTVWKNIKPVSTGRSLKLGSLIYWASKNGWTFPKEARTANAIADSVNGKNNSSCRNLLRKITGRKRVEVTPDSGILEFDAGDRQSVIKSAISNGHRYILDISATGTGKSHYIGEFKPSDYGMDRAFYLSAEHRNPTVEGIEENYVDMPSRNNGLYQDVTRKTPLGKNFVRHPQKGEIANTAGNCSRAEMFHKLEAKNQSAHSLSKITVSTKEGKTFETNPICGSCPVYFACKNGSGDGYGFIYARSQVINKSMGVKDSRVRMHADQFPTDSNFGNNAIAFWDEAGKIKPTKTIKVGLDDLRLGFEALEGTEAFKQLLPLKRALMPLLSGEMTAYYGFDDTKVRELLPELSENLPKVIAEIEKMTVEGSEIGTEADKVYSDPNLPKSARDLVNKSLNRENIQKTQENIEKLKTNWLLPFLKVWTRAEHGAVRVDNQKLLITEANARYGEIAGTIPVNIFLDATATKTQIALNFGINLDDILVIRQRVPESKNLKVIQVIGLGQCTQQRRESQQSRINAAISTLKGFYGDENIAIFDFKKHAVSSGADGYWFNHTRGSNEFKAKSAIALIGNPCPNLGAIQDEYLALNKGNLEGFEVYYQNLVDGEIIQAIGRLRANLRGNEQLTAYFLTNTELAPELKAEQIQAGDLSADCLTRGQIMEQKIKDAINSLIKSGKQIKDISQYAIAEFLGLARGTISYYSDWIKLLLGDLYNNLIQNSNTHPVTNSGDSATKVQATRGKITLGVNVLYENTYYWVTAFSSFCIILETVSGYKYKMPFDDIGKLQII